MGGDDEDRPNPVALIAMSLLACAYLSVQYLLALERANFLWVLAIAVSQGSSAKFIYFDF